ncbi:MAG: amino acid adenylation domain-containing protein [Acidobacteriota bacterium]
MTETVEGFRLSPQQRRIWRSQERDGARPYRTTALFHVDGELDAERLRRALDSVAMRHEILRTTYQRLPGMGEPLQVVGLRSVVAFETVDTADPTNAFRTGDRDFDLSKGPVGCVVFGGVEGVTRLLFDLPSLSADRAGIELLATELGAAYESGSPAAGGPQAPLQYADVAQWSNELPDRPESAPALAFWKRLERVHEGPDELPFERVPEAGDRFDPRRLPVLLPEGTFDRVERIARDADTTPEFILLACWCVLLRRLTSSDPTVARACDGRGVEDLRAVVGAFARSLPLRPMWDESTTLREAARLCAGDAAEQDRWQDLFLWDTAVGAAEPVEASCAFEFASPAPFRIGRAVVHPIETSACFERFKVRLSAERSPEGIAVFIDHDASRVDSSVAVSLAERYATLLGSAIEQAEVPVSRLAMLPDDERRRLLVEWNDTGRQFADERPIHERFETAAARSPADTAVVCGQRRLTFSELNGRANAVARRLRDAGVVPDSVVALHVERSIEMVIGLLAIWKAGGAYLPLDPSLPAQRLALLLEDTGAKFRLTTKALSGGLSAGAGRILLLDPEHGSDSEPTNPSSSARPENLAYVLFTSGSTGRPKGVAVEHRQISNYVNAILEKLDPSAPSSFATVTTLAADLGNTSLFPPLVTGGRLYVVTEQRSVDPDGLADDFSREPVDYLKIVPSHLSALLTGSHPEKILPKRCLVLGGEPASMSLIERVRELAPGCRVVNHYGPTEATVGVTTHEVSRSGDSSRQRSVPVGRPLANCRVYVLDERDDPVPIGVAGELHIAGAGLARGYLNRPELTAERFIERLVGSTTERLYRTGDRARYRADGVIELLGRTDDQVKIHGFRIEPGEIEWALREHGAVHDAVVLPREFKDRKILVAYVVARPGRNIDSGPLRQFLLERLPESMIPAAFIELPRIPLTPNGKIDRSSLPLPDLGHGRDGKEPGLAQNPVEEALARAWQAVLGVDRIGVHENFFELGGDSILAIQIISRAAREGFRLTPRQLFEHQTVAALASVAVRSMETGAEQGTVSGSIPLTPIQHWFFAQEFAEPQHFNQSLVLECNEAIDPRVLEIALRALIHHHDALRLRFQRSEAGWEQRNAPSESGPVFSIAVLDAIADERKAEFIQRAAESAQSSLDLANGPLVKGLLFTSSGLRPDFLLLTVHHLAVDGVSWRVLIEDLERAYRQIRAGQGPLLGPKTTSFRDWALGLEGTARSDAIEEQARFWQSRVFPETAGLPRDRNGGNNTVATARSEVWELSEEETKDLLQSVPAVYRTQINDALLGALVQTLSVWTGRRTFSIELEGHGREDAVSGMDLSRTVGWFTARFPVLLELPPSSEPGQVIAAIKEQLREIPDRGIGYGILRYLRQGPGRRWRDFPDPEVSFNYLGQLDRLLPEESMFRVAPTLGEPRSLKNARSHLLSVEGKVRSGRLQVAWIYSEEVHSRSTILRLAAGFETALRALIGAARDGRTGDYTPSDFPRAKLSQKDLDTLLTKIHSTAGDRK